MLKCIKCSNEIFFNISNKYYECNTCVNKYNTINDIIITDTSIDTQLNVNDYINERADDRPIVNFIEFIKNLYNDRGKLSALEIASGPGNLTCQLLENDVINELWSSDISVDFLKYQQKNITNPICKFIQFNASNTFPFKDNSLDLVYGNSCLHHFVDYDKTLIECFRILKPGGIAIFGEPISTGIQPYFLMLTLVAEFDKREKIPMFTPNIYNRIKQFNIDNSMLLELAKTKNLVELNKYEDKYQYTIDHLLNLSKQIGFSDFTTIKDINKESFIYKPSIETYIQQVELYINSVLNNWKLPDKYKWIIELVYNTIVKPNLGESYCALFTVFCMKK
jgi:ubiquinone/menaquinone biosynthesis C-methylase UbiE